MGQAVSRRAPGRTRRPAPLLLLQRLAGIAVLLLICLPWRNALAAPPFEDTLAQRLQACTACHGQQGRAAPDGYYPRIAGKPAGYLYHQLLNFRDGRRAYGPMAGMVDTLDDAYLKEIADHFASLQLPYPPPTPVSVTAAQQSRGRQLALAGDAARGIAACADCHGRGLTGQLPHVPGLLGLPRDYLNAQLGAWRTGQRQAHAPDCMQKVALSLGHEDVAAVTGWLASQPVPVDSRPAPAGSGPAAATCGTAPAPGTTAGSPSADPVVARGAYLARLGNCAGCHTARGGSAYAGGRAIETPFGTVYAGNLTPDAATGIGRWTADDFWRALHEGRGLSGRRLLPVFPYTSYTQLTRPDSDAIFAYLRSLTPVAQPNRAHALRWPYGTQWALMAWRALYFRSGTWVDDPRAAAEWNRGAYLVGALGHCDECHNRRNALGATDSGRRLGGGLIPQQGWFAPSLLSDREAGVGNWGLAEIERFLLGGVTARGQASGPMGEVILHSTQHLNPADARAMAVFLQDLARRSPQTIGPSTVQPVAALPAGSAGERLYERHCASCHGAVGEGVAGAYPALKGNRAVALSDPTNLVLSVLRGGFAPATRLNPQPFGMPPFQVLLGDAEVAAVLTYVRGSWGNQAPPVQPFDVARLRTGLRP